MPRSNRAVPLALLLTLGAVLACGKGSVSPGDAGSNDAGGNPNDAGSNPTDAGSLPTDGGCIGADLLNSLGKTNLLIGASMADATAAAAPFDVRYIYIAGGIADGTGPCASCATNCTSGGTSCDNQHGCGWWGCYQYDQVPPGMYASNFVGSSDKNAQIPMFTYYEILQASGVQEGSAEVTETDNAAFMARYFNDFRFLLQQIGAKPAFLQIEPDFWGYAEQVNHSADLIPSKVSSANPTDCASQPETISGFGRCMIAMVRKYAPNAKVGLHGSSWGTGNDVTGSSDASLDVNGEAQKLAAFLVQAGAAGSDFVTVDASDRDAGYYQSIGRNTFWDATNATLPNFHRAFQWARALAEGVGRPILFWQVPLGNPAQNNTQDHWKDNRVDYFFAHTDELVTAHVAGTFFGAGAGGQTTPESDGGNLIAKAKAYAASPRRLCTP